MLQPWLFDDNVENEATRFWPRQLLRVKFTTRPAVDEIWPKHMRYFVVDKILLTRFSRFFDRRSRFDCPPKSVSILDPFLCRSASILNPFLCSALTDSSSTVGDAMRRKDGVLHIIGSLGDTLLKRKMYKDQLEMMLKVHVIPELRSEHGFMRARVSLCAACINQLFFGRVWRFLCCYLVFF